VAQHKVVLTTFESTTLQAAGTLELFIENGEKVLDSGWLDVGLSAGRGLPEAAVLSSNAIALAGTGATSLFGEKYGFSKLKYGIIYNPENGKIRLRAKLQEKPQGESVTFLYRVTKLDDVAEPAHAAETEPAEASAEEPSADPMAGSFYIENPPKFLHPGWRYTLRCHLPAGASESDVEWILTEGTSADGAGGETAAGSLTSYGEYTAPETPGAFEVKARLKTTGQEAATYMIVTA